MLRIDNPFIIVHGPKPGVGKSMLAMAVLDWLRHAKKTSAVLVDADTGNPNVFATCHQEPELAFIAHELGKPSSWTLLLRPDRVMPSTPVVVNTASGDATALLAGVRGITEDLTVLWVVDDDPEAPISLSAYLDAVAGTDAAHDTLHVVCNDNLTDGRDFGHYLASESAVRVAKAGGRTAHMEALARRVTALLGTGSHTIRSIAAGDSPGGVMFHCRAEMSRWRAVMWRELDELGLRAATPAAAGYA